MAVAGLLAAAATGFGISELAQGSGRSGSVGPGRVEPGITSLGDSNPFGADGKLVTMQQLRADLGYALPFPDSPLANSGNVGNIWENTATREAIVYYPSSGIELNYGGTGVDYTGFPAAQIQAIDGRRAIVEPAGSQGFPFATVMLPIPGGHLVELLSNGPLSDLVSVAKTLPIDGTQ